MNRLHLALLAGLAAAGPAHADLINSLRDGLWYCDFPSATCSFDAAVPDGDDTVRIQHNVTLWGQGATPTPPLLTVIDGLQIASGGWLGLYDGRALWTTGTSVLEGGRFDAVVNGGGDYENRGTLTVTSQTGADIVGVRTINRGLWRIADAARLNVSIGGGTSFNNFDGPGGTAVFELQGSAFMSMGGLFRNLGIVRKTGPGTATMTGTYRVELGGVDGGTIDIVDGELLLRDEPAGPGGVIEAYGTRLTAAPGAALRVADGGQYRFLSENDSPVVHSMSGGGKFILGEGGELTTDPVNGIIALLDFDPGELELLGGVVYGLKIRNDNTVLIAGPVTLAGFNNAADLLVAPDETLSLTGPLYNLPTAVIEFGAGSTITNAFNGYILNQGLVSKRGAGIGVLQDGAYDFSGSTGILAVESGTLERRGGGNSVGCTIWAASGATYRHLDSNGAPIFLTAEPSSLLTGAGNIEANLITLNGTIEPGDADIGTLTLVGGLHMNNQGRMRFDIVGALPSQLDRLEVDFFDFSPVGGTLIARFGSAFDPVPGQRFPLIATLTPPTILPALQYEGLQPGFQAHLEYGDGVIALVADSDGVNVETVFADDFESP